MCIKHWETMIFYNPNTLLLPLLSAVGVLNGGLLIHASQELG